MNFLEAYKVLKNEMGEFDTQQFTILRKELALLFFSKDGVKNIIDFSNK